jgi:hypothetical protein
MVDLRRDHLRRVPRRAGHARQAGLERQFMAVEHLKVDSASDRPQDTANEDRRMARPTEEPMGDRVLSPTRRRETHKNTAALEQQP